MFHITELPTIDLHCHLDGSLSLKAMEAQLGRPVSQTEVCVNENCTSLTEYLTKFDLPVQCLQTEEHLSAQSYAFMKQLPADHLKYIEVRFAPILSAHDDLSCTQIIESVLRGLEYGRQETGIDYNIISCAMRNFSMEDNLKMLDAVTPFIGKSVCAIDLAGDESRYPNELFQELFQESSHRNIPFVIHSGETGNVENVRTAFEYGASRIGHGLALMKDTDLMQEIAEKGIGIEMCPTSNLQTKAVGSLKEYPLDIFMNAGIKVSVNTDNRTVSQTTITRELGIIYDLYQDEGMIKQLIKNAEETSFTKF